LVRHPGDDDDWHKRIPSRQPLKYVPPAPQRQIQIQQHQIDLLGDELNNRLLAVASCRHFITGSLQNLTHGLAHRRIVVNDKHTFLHSFHAQNDFGCRPFLPPLPFPIGQTEPPAERP
jgi:hypothetical protein